MKNTKAIALVGALIIGGVLGLWRAWDRHDSLPKDGNEPEVAALDVRSSPAASENVEVGSGSVGAQAAPSLRDRVAARQLHGGVIVRMPQKSTKVTSGSATPSMGRTADLYGFLRMQSPPESMSTDRFHVRKNGIMGYLCNMPTPPYDLTDVLVGLYNDRSQDSVTRDYAVQHLGLTWYGRAGSVDQATIRDVLRAAASERNSSIGGTALLAISRISRTTGEFEGREVQNLTLAAAQDVNASELTRITAMRLCGQLGIEAALPVAKELAQSSRSFALALAAVTTVGDLGSSEDKSEVSGVVNDRAPCLNCD